MDIVNANLILKIGKPSILDMRLIIIPSIIHRLKSSKLDVTTVPNFCSISGPKNDIRSEFGYNLSITGTTEVMTLKLIDVGRYLTILGIIGLVILTLCLAGFDGYECKTLYAEDSGKSFATVVLRPGQKLRVWMDKKTMIGNSAYLVVESDEKEAANLADDWEETRNELIFEGDGEYSLKVIFEDSSADRRSAEIEIKWLVVN